MQHESRSLPPGIGHELERVTVLPIGNGSSRPNDKYGWGRAKRSERWKECRTIWRSKNGLWFGEDKRTNEGNESLRAEMARTTEGFVKEGERPTYMVDYGSEAA